MTKQFPEFVLTSDQIDRIFTLLDDDGCDVYPVTEMAGQELLKKFFPGGPIDGEIGSILIRNNHVLFLAVSAHPEQDHLFLFEIIASVPQRRIFLIFDILLNRHDPSLICLIDHIEKLVFEVGGRYRFN